MKKQVFMAAVCGYLVLMKCSTALASTVAGDRVDGIEWPWMKFLNSLADQSRALP